MSHLIAVIRHSWMDHVWRRLRGIPPDAAQIMAVMAAMPVLMLIHMIMPSQDIARGAFSISLGVLAGLVGALVEERRPWAGYAIGCVAVGWAAASVAVLALMRITDTDDDVVRMVWRTTAAAGQLWVVVAWGILAGVRHRWLSRRLARGAFFIATAGWLWFMFLNFYLPAEITPEWANSARTLAARTMSPIVEPGLALATWGWVIWLAVRWLIRHDDGRHLR